MAKREQGGEGWVCHLVVGMLVAELNPSASPPGLLHSAGHWQTSFVISTLEEEV